MNNHITIREAAEILGFHVEHVRRLVRESKIDGHRDGKRWHVSRASVMEYDPRSRANIRRACELLTIVDTRAPLCRVAHVLSMDLRPAAVRELLRLWAPRATGDEVDAALAEETPFSGQNNDMEEEFDD